MVLVPYESLYYYNYANHYYGPPCTTSIIPLYSIQNKSLKHTTIGFLAVGYAESSDGR